MSGVTQASHLSKTQCVCVIDLDGAMEVQTELLHLYSNCKINAKWIWMKGLHTAFIQHMCVCVCVWAHNDRLLLAIIAPTSQWRPLTMMLLLPWLQINSCYSICIWRERERERNCVCVCIRNRWLSNRVISWKRDRKYSDLFVFVDYVVFLSSFAEV